MSGKDLWVAALRSNKYNPNFRQLRIRDTFCATGVLADLYTKQFPDKAFWDKDTLCLNVQIPGGTVLRRTSEGASYRVQKPPFPHTQRWRLDLPLPIAEWGGLIIHKKADNVQSSDIFTRKQLVYKGKNVHVETLNDIYKLDFPVIADLLEQYI